MLVLKLHRLQSFVSLCKDVVSVKPNKILSVLRNVVQGSAWFYMLICKWFVKSDLWFVIFSLSLNLLLTKLNCTINKQSTHLHLQRNDGTNEWCYIYIECKKKRCHKNQVEHHTNKIEEKRWWFFGLHQRLQAFLLKNTKISAWKFMFCLQKRQNSCWIQQAFPVRVNGHKVTKLKTFCKHYTSFTCVKKCFWKQSWWPASILNN